LKRWVYFTTEHTDFRGKRSTIYFKVLENELIPDSANYGQTYKYGEWRRSRWNLQELKEHAKVHEITKEELMIGLI
jgi:hypothetical protein